MSLVVSQVCRKFGLSLQSMKQLVRRPFRMLPALWLQPVPIRPCQLPSVIVGHVKSQARGGTIKRLVSLDNQGQIGSLRVAQAKREKQLHSASIELRDCGLVAATDALLCVIYGSL